MTLRSISNVTSTWTSSGTAYTGIGLNVYATSYSSVSKPLDVRVNGSSVFSVDVAGTIKSNSVSIAFNTANSAYNFANNLAVASGDPSFAFKHANSAFDKANASFQNTTGTFNGTLTVTGSIYTGSYAVGYLTIPQNAQTSAYILAASDSGKHISITTGGVTVNASVFSVGDTVVIYNNSGSNQTITQGTNVTLRLSGTATTGNRTLAQYGTATIMCVTGGSTPVFVISGSGLS